MHFIPNISQNALIYPKVFKMETNNTKQAYHINYAFFVCVEENLLCDSTEILWITIKYISLAVILNQIPLQHALQRDQFNSDPHSWTEFWISLNWCLHLIHFHIPYFLSPLAHVLFINVKFLWKYNRTLNCHMYVCITYTTMDYSTCAEGDGEEQTKSGSAFLTGRVDKQTVKP